MGHDRANVVSKIAAWWNGSDILDNPARPKTPDKLIGNPSADVLCVHAPVGDKKGATAHAALPANPENSNGLNHAALNKLNIIYDIRYRVLDVCLSIKI